MQPPVAAGAGRDRARGRPSIAEIGLPGRPAADRRRWTWRGTLPSAVARGPHRRRACASTGTRSCVGRVGDAPSTPDDAARSGVGRRCAWRGFSAEVTPDGREPFGYDYARVSAVVAVEGDARRATRATGDVAPLLRATDDMFVISRPGDEIALSFDATALPPLPRRAGRGRSCSTPTASARR